VQADQTAAAFHLRAELREHNERYYVQDDPSIGDDQYDALLDELRELERDNPELVTADSPTQRVGAEPVSALEKVTHPQAMFSLANARSPEEFDGWVLRMRNHLAREGIEDLGSLAAIVGVSDIILSIMPPESAEGFSCDVAAEMKRQNKKHNDAKNEKNEKNEKRRNDKKKLIKYYKIQIMNNAYFLNPKKPL
jgi:hypothetical protein